MIFQKRVTNYKNPRNSQNILICIAKWSRRLFVSFRFAKTLESILGGGRSRSTEQLDRLLRGLDELSGTLPDLGVSRVTAVDSGRTREWDSGRSDVREEAATSGVC